MAPKSELERIAIAPQDGGRPRRAVRDRHGILPGRGAYLCRDERSDAPAIDCVARAERRSAIARALRCRVTIDLELIESTSQ